MAERTERDAIHHLIDVCRDGERGFRAAAAAVSEPKLKALFNELADERARFAADLMPHLRRLGDSAEGDEGTSAGALHRGWINVKSHVPGHNDHSIVAEARRGEQKAEEAYQEALNGMLPPTVVELIETQQNRMHEVVDRIRAIDMGYA